jgi:cell division septation protein DedD
VRSSMGLRDFLRKSILAPKAKSADRPLPADSAQPKNGRITLAVIASMLVMIPLAVLNVRLILDPSIAGKAFGTSVPSRPIQDSGTGTPICSLSDDKGCEVPPEVTFYSKLSAQDDQTRTQEQPSKDPVLELDAEGTSHRGNGPADSKVEKARANREGKESGTNESKASVAQGTDERLPQPDATGRVYVVQVGAFTHPSIAQQWALTWKSRGYDVMLKPVARPSTGVTYRLYLGKFESQKEADALVKKLKAKEGISAFRLLVRN